VDSVDSGWTLTLGTSLAYLVMAVISDRFVYSSRVSLAAPLVGCFGCALVGA
jgi:hypothetical protein